MVAVTAESWRALPDRSHVYAELAAEAVPGVDGVFLAVDHEGARHLLLSVESDVEPFTDERSRGIRALTRPLSVQGQPERHFVDVLCTAVSGQEVFNLVATAILGQVDQGAAAPEAVRNTLARWRRFWGAAPAGGLRGRRSAASSVSCGFSPSGSFPTAPGSSRTGLAPPAPATTSSGRSLRWRRRPPHQSAAIFTASTVSTSSTLPRMDACSSSACGCARRPRRQTPSCP